MLEILRITTDHIDNIVPLFNAYRVFYGKESDFASAKTFLFDRLSNHQSIILGAVLDRKTVGFTQLYTTYSSVSMQPYYILNDLFVSKEFRGNGIGQKLLEAAKELCSSQKFKGLSLETATDNPAQQLYEKMGWEKDSEHLHYFWTNTNQNP